MRIKVGDKVRFLNETGGGVVTKIISTSLVNVLIDEGFEIPTALSELIKIGDTDDDMIISDHQENNHHSEKSFVSGTTINPFVDSIGLIKKKEKGMLPEGVYFAMVPQDQKFMVTGLIDWYVLNNTSAEILFSIINEQDACFEGMISGQVNAASMKLIKSLDRDEFEKYSNGFIQVIFHFPGEESSILHPGSTSYAIQPGRLLSEKNYKYSGMIEGKAVFISLLPLQAQLRVADKNSKTKVEKLQEPIIQEAEIVNPVHVIDPHKTSPREAVVDLHLSELVEDESKVEDHEKLSIQMDYFKSCLESALLNYITKLTFIHGVGKGVLKQSILDYLEDYPMIEVRDASMKEFGYGATVLLIRYNYKVQ